MNVELPHQFQIIFRPEIKIIIAETGRSAGKSTTISEIAVLLMMQNRQNNIVCARAEKADLRNSVFSGIIKATQMLGLENEFSISLSPLEITCKRSGAKCYFLGINGKTADDLTATKGFEPQGKIALYFLDEANEAKCKEHVASAQSTMVKFMQPYGSIVYAFNPSIRLTHWSHSFFENISNYTDINLNLKIYRIYLTWENIRGLLNEATIAEIEAMRENDPLHYRFVYLGERVSLEGRVIWSYSPERNLIQLSAIQKTLRKNIYYQPINVFYGVDSGVKQDATAVTCWGIYPDGKLIKLHTFYLDIKAECRKTGKKGVSNSDQAKYIYRWYQEMRKELSAYGIVMPDKDHEIWCFDGAAITQDLKLEWEKLTRFHTKAITNKDIERDVARLVNSYQSGMLLILDIEANRPSIREIENFCRDDQNEIPEGQSDHTIDADKYATYYYYYAFL